MACFRTVCLACSVFLFEACAVTEQTPGDVGQKFEEGIKGNGQIVPNDKDQSQTGPSNDSPVTKPAGAPQPQSSTRSLKLRVALPVQAGRHAKPFYSSAL